VRVGNEVARGAPSSAGWLILLVTLSGVALALLASSVPASLAVAAVVGMIFLVVFVQRPDLGLLFVVFIRSCTDLSFAFVNRAAPASAAAGSTSVAVGSSPFNVGLVLTVIFVGGVFVLSRGIPFLSLPGGTAFALLLLSGLMGLLRAVGVAHSESLVYGMNQWLRPVSALVIYALAAHVFRTPKAIQGVIDVIAAAFVIPALFGFYQLLRRNLPINGTFVDQNAFAVFLVLIFSIFLCQALAQSGTRKLLALSIVGCSAVLLAATYARTSWVAAVVILMVVGALRKHVFLVLVPLAVVIAVGMVPSIANRLANPFEGSFADRVGIWQTTGPVWMSATQDEAGAVSTGINRLIGTGPGSIGGLVLSGHGIANMEHNDYLAVLYEYGMLGVVAYVLMYLTILVSEYRTWRRCTDERMASIALNAIAATLGLMTMSLTDNIFGLTQNQIYFWTLVGLTVAISRLSARAGGSKTASAESQNLALARTGRRPVREFLPT